MSHTLRRMQRPDGDPPKIDSCSYGSFWVSGRLPTPQEQADALILWIGDRQAAAADYVRATRPEIGGIIGLPVTSKKTDADHFAWLNTALQVKGLYEFKATRDGTAIHLQLTMLGWEKYESLKETRIESRTIFMALKFNEPNLNEVVEKCFRPAVERTGFKLRLLTDRQPAGLIDDQLRAAILASRLVISDLTHGSRGAYWEAGYAEGLHLPVIYTCEKTKWMTEKTHFDTNHLVTIIWDSADLKKAEDGLVDTIRATLRAEAKQSD